MKLTIEMDDPLRTFFEEIANRKITQDGIAITYAFMIAQLGDAAPWREINAAISARWNGLTSLVRVKEKAWKHVEYWKSRKAEETK